MLRGLWQWFGLARRRRHSPPPAYDAASVAALWRWSTYDSDRGRRLENSAVLDRPARALDEILSNAWEGASSKVAAVQGLCDSLGWIWRGEVGRLANELDETPEGQLPDRITAALGTGWSQECERRLRGVLDELCRDPDTAFERWMLRGPNPPT